MKKFIFICLASVNVFTAKAQDIIRKIDGTELKTKVLEVNPGDIKYKKFGFTDGPTYTILIKDISKITYTNGDVETFGKVVEQKNPIVKEVVKPIQQTVVSGFTNKAEAKNITDANGLRQGKWLVYINEKHKLFELPNKVNADYYRLVIYKDGNFSGIERLYSLSGELLTETFYENGKTEENTFYENGKLHSILPKKNGNFNGTHKVYSIDGNLFLEWNYVNGERLGTQKQYNILDGSLQKTEILEAKPKEIDLPDSIVGDLENGLVKVFSGTGFLKNEIPYKNGKINGTKKTYNENGTLIKEGIYTDDKRQGIFREYSKTGQLLVETSYENDKRNGIQKIYSANGDLFSETQYENGKENGISKIYLGSLYSEIPYENGKKNGIQKDYRDGKIASEIPYENGKKNGIQKDYLDGKIYREDTYKDGLQNGVSRYYFRYDPFEEITESLYVDGQKNGLEKRTKNGILICETPYQNGKKNGIEKSYYSDNGQIKSITPYLDDQIHGVDKYYDYKGHLKSQTFYVHGSIDKKAQRKEDFNSFVRDASVIAAGTVQIAQVNNASHQYLNNPNATNLNNYSSIIKNNLTLNPKDAIVANSQVLTNSTNTNSVANSTSNTSNNQAESSAVTANTTSGKDGNSAEGIACAKEAQREYENTQEFRNYNNNQNNIQAPIIYYGELAKAKNAEILLNHCGQYLSNQEKEALNSLVIDCRKMANELTKNKIIIKNGF